MGDTPKDYKGFTRESLLDLYQTLFDEFGFKKDSFRFGGINPGEHNNLIVLWFCMACNKLGMKFRVQKSISAWKTEMLRVLSVHETGYEQFDGVNYSVDAGICAYMMKFFLKHVEQKQIFIKENTYQTSDGMYKKQVNAEAGISWCSLQGWLHLGYRPALSTWSAKHFPLIVLRSIVCMTSSRGHGRVFVCRKENCFFGGDHPFALYERSSESEEWTPIELKDEVSTLQGKEEVGKGYEDEKVDAEFAKSISMIYDDKKKKWYFIDDDESDSDDSSEDQSQVGDSTSMRHKDSK